MIRDFLLHLFPRMTVTRNLRIRYTMCLGGLAFTMFLLLTVTGILLMLHYTPGVQDSYRSILFIEEQVTGGKFLRSLHRMSSHLMLILLFLHTLRVLLTGAYSARRYSWVVGVLLLLLTVSAAYTGYLLPMDQLAWWATVTGMELLRIMPGGGVIADILAPGGVGTPLSISRFYALHVVVLPLGIVTGCMLHFFRIRKDKGVLPYL